MSKITLNRLQEIIREEISNLSEGAEHESAAENMKAATKFLSAIESFKDSATAKAISEFGTSLEQVEKTLKRIIDSPMQYAGPSTGETKDVVKKVTLKPQKQQMV